MQNQQLSQVLLISTKLKSNKIFYQVEKEGVSFLRKFKNKKFRIIFNIIPISQKNIPNLDINHFCNHLLNQDQKNNQNFNFQKNYDTKTIQSTYSHSQTFQSSETKKQINYTLPSLTISNKFKIIQNNRIVVCFNAYLPISYSPSLLIFSYLISSVIFYHNWSNSFSQSSHLTQMLCEFRKIVKQTDIDKLNEEVKFQKGFQKFPYFMCLIAKTSKTQTKEDDQYLKNYFNHFYRFDSESQNSKINQALQTIIDYFPQRSSLGIQVSPQPGLFSVQFAKEGIKQISKLGDQFQETILGRQLFNFQFTGTSVQNLAFQMCEWFNNWTESSTKLQQINLVQMYKKVILNKKQRVLDECLKYYVNNVQREIFFRKNIDFQSYCSQKQQQIKSKLPISDLELNKILNEIKMLTIQQASTQAQNCMNLEQYLLTQAKLIQKISIYQKNLHGLNSQLGVKFLNQCFEVLQISEQDLKIDKSTRQNSQLLVITVTQKFYLLLTKIQSFSNECLSLFTEQDQNSTQYNEMFLRLIRGYWQKMQLIVIEILNQKEIQKRKDKLELQTVTYELKKSKQLVKQLEEKYELQLLVSQEYKNQVKSLMFQPSICEPMNYMKKSESSTSTFNSSKEFYRLKKQIQQLQQEVKDKNNHIEELTQVLQKFQSTLLKTSSMSLIQKKNDKFTDTTIKFISQANSKINKFYQILEEVKNVQKHYQSIKKSLMKQKQKIVSEKRQSIKQILEIKEKNQKLKNQNQKLQQIIYQQKSAVQKFNLLKNTLKQATDQLQTSNANLTCSLAQTEGELQMYRKAVTLLVENSTKGKSQNLQKFYKLIDHADLKELLKPITNKK